MPKKNSRKKTKKHEKQENTKNKKTKKKENKQNKKNQKMLRLEQTHCTLPTNVVCRSEPPPIERVGTDDPRMSKIVKHGNTIYFSGQVAEDFDSSLSEQVCSTLSKVDDLLHLAGTNKSQLLSAQLWLRNMSDFGEMNVIWNEWIDKENKPVRACTQASLARENILFEVMVIAAEPPHSK